MRIFISMTNPSRPSFSSGRGASSTIKNQYLRPSIYTTCFLQILYHSGIFLSDLQRISATSKQLLNPPNHSLFGGDIECDFQLKKPLPLVYTT